MAQELILADKFSAPDFYAKTDEVVQELQNRIAVVESTAFEISEDGKKQLKDFQASENKIIKLVDDVRKSEYAKLTADIKVNHDLIFNHIKLWSSSLKNKSNQFEEFERKLLDDVRLRLLTELDELIIEATDLRPEFVSKHDIEPIVKLTGVFTEGGKLTKKTDGFLKTLINGDVARQQLHDNRILQIKVKCHENDIKTPFDKNYLGESFYGTNEEFNVKLDLLVANEVDRVKKDRERIEAELTKKHEAEIQQKVDEQVKAKVAKKTEELRAIGTKLQPEVIKSPSPTPTPSHEELHNRARHLNEMALHCDNYSESNKLSAEASKLKAQANELTKNLAGKKKVVEVTVTFIDNQVRNLFNQTLNQAIIDSVSVITLKFSVDAFKSNQEIIEKFELFFADNADFLSAVARDA